MQVRRLAHAETLVLGQHGVERIAGFRDASFGLRIDRDPALPARGRGAPPALLLDQHLDRVAAVADDLGRPAHGRRDDLLVDHDDAQVLAAHVLLEDDLVASGAGRLYRRLERIGLAHVDADSRALLAARRLDDHGAVLGEKTGGLVAVGSLDLRRHRQPGPAQHAPCRGLVDAHAHRDRRRELAQRLAADDAAAAEAEPEIRVLGVDHLDIDAAPLCLADDDLCV